MTPMAVWTLPGHAVDCACAGCDAHLIEMGPDALREQMQSTRALLEKLPEPEPEAEAG